MRNIDFEKHIENIQQNLDMPVCFELSREKLREQATIEMLINRITTNTLRAGDQFALLEIIKDWLKAFEPCEMTAEEKAEHSITFPQVSVGDVVNGKLIQNRMGSSQ